jgi:hypothetical protein
LRQRNEKKLAEGSVKMQDLVKTVNVERHLNELCGDLQLCPARLSR